MFITVTSAISTTSIPMMANSPPALTPRHHLPIWRTRHAGAGLRRDHPQKPGFGVSGRGHPSDDAALRHAATKSTVYRRHPRQEAGCADRPEEGGGHRGWQRFGSAAVVEIERVAAPRVTRRLYDTRLTKPSRTLERRMRWRSAASDHVLGDRRFCQLEPEFQ